MSRSSKGKKENRLSRQLFKDNLGYQFLKNDSDDILPVFHWFVMWWTFFQTHPVACVRLNGTESTGEEENLEIQQTIPVKFAAVWS